MKFFRLFLFILLFTLQIDYCICQVFNDVVKQINLSETRFIELKNHDPTSKDFSDLVIEIKNNHKKANEKLTAIVFTKKKECSITYYYTVTKLRLIESKFNEFIGKFNCKDDLDALNYAYKDISSNPKKELWKDMDSIVLVNKFKQISPEDNNELNKISSARDNIFLLNRMHKERIDEIKQKCNIDPKSFNNNTEPLDEDTNERKPEKLSKPRIGFPSYSICSLNNATSVKFNQPICLKERIQVIGRVDVQNIIFKLFSLDSNNIIMLNIEKDEIANLKAESLLLKDFCFKIKENISDFILIKIQAIEKSTKELISESEYMKISIKDEINCY